jgi:hypothetical protein
MIHRMSRPGYFRILTILVIRSQENGIAFAYFVYFAVQLCAHPPVLRSNRYGGWTSSAVEKRQTSKVSAGRMPALPVRRASAF